MNRYLIYVTEQRRVTPFKFFGKSGRAYAVRWCEEHKVMCIEGRVLEAAEFARMHEDCGHATREQNDCDLWVKVLTATAEQGGDEGEPLPVYAGNPKDKTISDLLGQLGAAEEKIRQLQAARPTPHNAEPKQPAKPAPAPVAQPSTYDPDDAPAVTTATLPTNFTGTYDPDDL